MIHRQGPFILRNEGAGLGSRAPIIARSETSTLIRPLAKGHPQVFAPGQAFPCWPDFINSRRFLRFSGCAPRQVVDCIGPSVPASVAPTKSCTAFGAARVWACFCAISFAARTARSIGPNRWLRTHACRAAAWINPSRRRKSRPRSTPKRLELLARCSADFWSRPPAISMPSRRSLPQLVKSGWGRESGAYNPAAPAPAPHCRPPVLA